MSIQIMHLVGIDAGVLQGVDHAAPRPVGVRSGGQASPLIPNPDTSA